jgi:hypothetical protein
VVNKVVYIVTNVFLGVDISNIFSDFKKISKALHKRAQLVLLMYRKAFVIERQRGKSCLGHLESERITFRHLTETTCGKLW